MNAENNDKGLAGRAKIFLSYSRRQVEFADEMELALEDKGYDVLVDRHNIAKGEDFQRRLGQMILASDSIVFILSNESATSDVCEWEINEALALGKRILVVSIGDLREGVAPPQSLAKLDWIHCWRNPAVPGSSQTKGFIELDQALRSDLKWLRMQTWLLERSTEWAESDLGFESIQDNSALLLRGTVLEEAIEWLTNSPPHASISPKVRSFLDASELLQNTTQSDAARRLAEQQAAIEEAKRAVAEREKANELALLAHNEREAALRRMSRRTAIGITATGALTLGASGLAYWANNAERRFQKERQRVAEAQAVALENAISEAARNPNISGQITAYAASPGEFASDGEPGENSPYTAAVLSQLQNRDQSLLDGLMNAHALVRTQTPQHPYLATNANADIYLRRLPATWKKRALCVSNPHFPHLKDAMINVERDAVSWTEFLGDCGFETTRLHAPTLDAFEKGFEWLAGKPAGAPSEVPAPQRMDQEADPRLFLFFFYSGIGFINGAMAALGAGDSAGEVSSDGSFRVTKALMLTPRLEAIRLNSGLSVAVLDTNFNQAVFLDEDVSVR